jgi:pSer/pThr/pTyr-binding forkhead associated (FHA) protein
VQDTAQWEESPSQADGESKQQRPWARCVSTNPKFPNVDLVEPDVIFGRKGGCGVQLLHPAISGQHCRIVRDGKNMAVLKDLSTNGTFVNNKRVGKGRQTLLSNNAEIVLIRTVTEKISYLFFFEDATKPEEGGPEKEYVINETLGTGAFATVKMCAHKETSKKFAVKIIDKKKFAMNHGSSRNNALMVRGTGGD